MALAKERIRQNPPPVFSQGIDPSSFEFFGFKGHHHIPMMIEEEGHLPTTTTTTTTTLFGPNSKSSSSFGVVNSLPHEWAYSSSSSVLSFEQPKIDQECALWIDTVDREYQTSCVSSRIGPRRDANCFEERFGLMYPSATAMDGFEDGGEVERSGEHPYMGGDVQASKKQCGNNRKAKAKPSPSKDPQSIAAKNRRERISERLKILQELVPNGTKVDLVTMLEKAISYVKFLQLQVKVLATDEFWPAQGGKAPEVAQVKEAIDAILSSHRDRNSSSKQ